MSVLDKVNEQAVKEETSREDAKRAIAALLNAIIASDKEESVNLVSRHPDDGSKGISVEISYNGASVTAPLYACYIVQKLAHIAGVPFEKMINFIEVFNELLPEVSMEEETVEEDTFENETDQ